MIRMSIKKDFIIVLVISITISLIVGIFSDVSKLFLLSLAIVFSTIYVYSKSIYKDFGIVCFMLTFFFFVMGYEFINTLYNGALIRDTSLEANSHYYLSVLLSLIGIIFGYQIKIGVENNVDDFKEFINKKKVISTRKVAKYVFFATYLFWILPVIERVLFVREFSYYESYVSYSSNIPALFLVIGKICPIVFSLYLATFPSKQECKLPIYMYVFHAFIYLLTGKRYMTVVSILFLVIYFIIRNNTDKVIKVEWISKGTVRLLIMLLPFVGAGLAAYSTIRTGSDLDSSFTTQSLLLSLFTNVADTDRVIKYGYMYEELFPDGHIYSFGNVIDYFKYGFIANLITDDSVRVSQTVEYALEGNNFAYILSYIYYPSMFLTGHGLGSCYIAELYKDAGYIGIILGNIFLGLLFKNIFTINFKSIWSSFLVIYLFWLLLLIPRSSYDIVFREIIALSFIVTIIIINILIKIDLRREERGKICG